MPIRFSANRLVALLGIGFGLLVIASVAGQVYRHVTGNDRFLVTMFYVDAESNFPSWYEASLLLLCAMLLLGIGLSLRQGAQPLYRYWLGLAGIFLFLAMDEAIRFHEQVSTPLRNAFGLEGALHFSWVIPYLIFAGVVGLLYLRFLFRIPPATAKAFVLAGVLYVGGAVGLEMAAGIWKTDVGEEVTLLYTVLPTIEEILEVAGMLVFIHALLRYIEQPMGGLHLEVGR